MRFDFRNDPCAQSWKTMKVRSRKPAATTENAPASHGENLSATHAAVISARYVATEVKMFEIARLGRGTA